VFGGLAAHARPSKEMKTGTDIPNESILWVARRSVRSEIRNSGVQGLQGSLGLNPVLVQ
jgi:hypothetical protein